MSTVVLAALTTLIVLSVMWVAVSTGPGCPGMDPGWIGWCQSPGATQ